MDWTDVVGYILRIHRVATQDHQTLHHIAQFPDVAGPGHLLKLRYRIRAERLCRHAGLGAYLLHEMVDKQRNVIFSLIQ